MKWLIEKIEQTKKSDGTYIFDLSDREERNFVLENLGGENKLRLEHPGVIDSILSNSYGRKDQDMLQQKVTVTAAGITYKKDAGKISLQGSIRGFLCDPAITVNELGSATARPWQRAFVTIRMINSDDKDYPVLGSQTLYYKDINDFSENINFGTELIAKNVSVVILVTGIDPDGKTLSAAFYSKHPSISADVAIKSITIEAPKYADEKYQNNPLIMLYGRQSTSNEKFKHPDYSGGEYQKNNSGTVGDKDLKTLMPLKGTVELNPGYTFCGLYEPTEEEAIPRPVINLNQSILVKYYQDEWDKGGEPYHRMYEAIKDSFTFDETKSICYFDVKIDDSVNWHADVKDAASHITPGGERSLIYFVGATFQLAILAEGLEATVDLNIQSTDDPSYPLYVATGRSPAVYIPPVQVYWGCLEKNSMVKTDKGNMRIADIVPGEYKVYTKENGYVTVAQVIKGFERNIYRIKFSEKLSIGLTETHPVLMANNQTLTAGELKKGMLVLGENGEALEIVDIKKESYNDEAYNLMTEDNEPLNICINGVFVGSMASQNKVAKPEISYTEEQIAIQKDWDLLAESMNVA